MSWFFLTSLSHEGVIVFFVLSGYIICLSTTNKNRTPTEFLIARLSRLYSVAAPSLIAGSVISIVISYTIIDPYDAFSNYSDVRVIDIFGQFLFLSQSWNLFELPSLNNPFWSLCYEFWYYIAFAVFIYGKRPWRWIMLLTLGVLVGPGIVALAPIWAAGAWYAYHGKHWKLPPILAILMLVATVAVFLATSWSGIDVVIKTHFHQLVPGFWRLESGQRLFSDYILGGAMILHLVAAKSLMGTIGPVLLALRKQIVFMAGFSFSLYMFHRPLTQIGGWVFPIEGTDIVRSLAAASTIILVCYLFSLISERQTGWLRRLLTRTFTVRPPIGTMGSSSTSP